MSRTTHVALLVLLLGLYISQTAAVSYGKLCDLKPLGTGRDDTDQVENAISRCGKYGLTTLATGNYNITRSVLHIFKVSLRLISLVCFSRSLGK